MDSRAPDVILCSEPGSPIIALESARTHRANLTGHLLFLFVEERTDRADYLDNEISKLDLPSHFEVKVERGTFANKVGSALDTSERDWEVSTSQHSP